MGSFSHVICFLHTVALFKKKKCFSCVKMNFLSIYSCSVLMFFNTLAVKKYNQFFLKKINFPKPKNAHLCTLD